MIRRHLFVAAIATCFAAFPAVAQTPKADSQSGPHYSGGPKADPYHVGKKETTGPAKSKSSGGSHHYSGGPKSEVPHHIGPKKD